MVTSELTFEEFLEDLYKVHTIKQGGVEWYHGPEILGKFDIGREHAANVITRYLGNQDKYMKRFNDPRSSGGPKTKYINKLGVITFLLSGTHYRCDEARAYYSEVLLIKVMNKNIFGDQSAN